MWCDVVLIADPSRVARGGLPDIVRAALEGGVTAVELRDKTSSTRMLIEEALALRGLTRSRSVPLIVNDRLDVALAADADGVHLGPDDLPLALARRLLPGGMLLGFSAGTPDEAVQAEHAGATYLGVGSIRQTKTKPDAGAPIGFDGLAAVRAVTSLPVLAVGGIGPAEATRAIAAGAHGVAVASAIIEAPDPRRAARTIVEAVQRGRSARVEEAAGATGDAP